MSCDRKRIQDGHMPHTSHQSKDDILHMLCQSMQSSVILVGIHASFYRWPSGRHKPGGTHSLQTVPPQQFQALFDSLFKVLFIFPSRYLFAIGLPPVFSLRWDLPPALGCIPKQPDSAKAPRVVTQRQPTGFSPSRTPPSRGLGPAGSQRWLL